MMRDLTRLLRPRSIAVVGGGAWGAATVAQCRKMGFAGPIWPVHPSAAEIGGLTAYRSIADLPEAPDATFIGVNRHATVEVVEALARRGAGGAVCFASGFSEAAAEDAGGADLQAALLAAAGGMPILGPNCYGFINYLDGALLWPDQHGGTRVASGVAIITQSSNIALNITMQRRALPLAYVVTAGNQAQTGLAEIGRALLADDRVTALGLHIEGVGDLRAFEGLAQEARDRGKRIVALKVGKSAAARTGAVSHTASLAGGDAGAAALLARLGIARAGDLTGFLETLKLLHIAGPLPSRRIASLSCSGGEASLIADLGEGRLDFPALNDRQRTDLRAALGPMVALANPLDYHTYIWRDAEAMTATFAAMIDPDLAMTLLIADVPRADRCDPSDWDPMIVALIAAKERTGGRVGMAATLPETMPEAVAEHLTAAGIVPFFGLSEAITACELASLPEPEPAPPLLLPTPTVAPDLVSEAEAKVVLATHGLVVPQAVVTTRGGLVDAAKGFDGPVVLKAAGLAHKTEAGGVALGLETPQEILAAAEAMPGEDLLIEEMIGDAVTELLIGVVKDPAHGFVLTLGAGGTLAEVLDDTVSLLVPATGAAVGKALDGLRMAPVLAGYRGKPAADRAAIIAAVMTVQDYTMARAEGLEEIEINPLICTPTRAVAADVLLRRKDAP